MLWQFLSTFLRRLAALFSPHQPSQCLGESQQALPDVTATERTGSCAQSIEHHNRKGNRLARAKKRIHLAASFDVQIEDWQQFINSIPGRKYDGIDLSENDQGEVEIVAGYGITHDGDRKEYTASDKVDMQAYAASLAGDVANINQAAAS